MQEPLPPSPAAPGSLRGPTPWERRAELGFFAGFWRTWRDSLFTPQTFWPSMEPNGNVIDALLYGWLSTLIHTGPGMLFGYVSMKLQLGPVGKSLRDLDSTPGARQLIEWVENHTGLFVVVTTLATLALYPLGQIISAGMLHLFGLITGCAKNGFNATFRVVAYSQGTRVVDWVPCLGMLASLYQLGLIVFGLSKAHDSTTGRAVAAVLLPIALASFCVCGCFAIGLVAGMAGAGR